VPSIFPKHGLLGVCSAFIIIRQYYFCKIEKYHLDYTGHAILLLSFEIIRSTHKREAILEKLSFFSELMEG
jgi:hypothetical protein